MDGCRLCCDVEGKGKGGWNGLALADGLEALEFVEGRRGSAMVGRLGGRAVAAVERSEIRGRRSE